MEKLSNSSHFLDLGGLDSLRAQAQRDEQGALKQVAQQFEGIFVQMLMKSMREANAVFESDSPMNSQYTKFYEQMHDQQMSVELSSKGVLGLADVMVQQLSPKATKTQSAFAENEANALERQGLSVERQAMPLTRKASKAPELGQRAQDDVNPQALSQLAAENPPSTAVLNDTATLNNQATMAAMADPNDVTSLFFDAVQALQPSKLAEAPALAELDKVLSGKSLPTPAKVAGSEQINSQADFVRVLYPYAVKAAEAIGTEPELLLAQSALETGWGQKMVKGRNGDPSYNLFNIKADRRWQGHKAQVSTLEYEQGIAVRQNANFRVYDNFEDSFNDLVNFIATNDRYQHARTQADKPAEFIRSLHRAGYATDPQYANKVLKVLSTIKSDFAEFLVKEAQ
ncbi:MAG: flagellar assembly peptidoglycan hydrolase FlgJ [Shewanella sp.]|uniref:flagellar assembly peptidoglycan hydrolase FlgJ n=1 Tax=Shewanella sp. TaxID=50422 RepID=UPI003F2F6A48